MWLVPHLGARLALADVQHGGTSRSCPFRSTTKHKPSIYATNVQSQPAKLDVCKSRKFPRSIILLNAR